MLDGKNYEKERILKACSEPGCVISKIAARYGVRARLLYQWRSKARAGKELGILESEDDGNSISKSFIELVPEKKEMSVDKALSLTRSSRKAASGTGQLMIEKIRVELKFAEFSFKLEGKISSVKYQRVIELLSSVCCYCCQFLTFC